MLTRWNLERADRAGRMADTAKPETTTADTRRDEIIAAAIEVFQRSGFRGSTLEDVAARVGVSKSLVYYYFSSKQALLAEIYARVGFLLNDRIFPALADDRLPHAQKLHDVIKEHIAVIVENREIFSIYFRERHELTEAVLEETGAGRERGYVRMLRELIEDGIKAGAFAPTDARVAAFTILGACNWIMHWFREAPKHGPSLRADELADAMFRLLGGGLLLERGPAANGDGPAPAALASVGIAPRD